MHATPWHLWVVGIIAVLWNAVGGVDYIMTQTANEAYLAGFTQEQRDYYLNMPVWVDAVWAIAIWSAVLASVLLLLRKAWAAPLFLVSLVFMAISFIYGYLIADAPASTFVQTAMTVVIVIAAVLLAVYAHKMKGAGVLR